MHIVEYIANVLDEVRKKRAITLSKKFNGDEKEYTYNISPDKTAVNINEKNYRILLIESGDDCVNFYAIDEKGDLYRIKIPKERFIALKSILEEIREEFSKYTNINLSEVSKILLDPLSNKEFREFFRKTLEESKIFPDAYIRKLLREGTLKEMLYGNKAKKEAKMLYFDEKKLKDIFYKLLTEHIANYPLEKLGRAFEETQFEIKDRDKILFEVKKSLEESYKLMEEFFKDFHEIKDAITENIRIEKLCKKDKNKVVIIGYSKEPVIIDLKREGLNIKATEEEGGLKSVFLYWNGDILKADYDIMGIPRTAISLKTLKKVI